MGGTRLICGSCAAPPVNAFREISTPGIIETPVNDLLSSTSINFVAVPISIIKTGGVYSFAAATHAHIKSAPTCAGLSASKFIPVFIPGPTITALTLKTIFIAFAIVWVRIGTTDDIAAPQTSLSSTPYRLKMLLSFVAYSASVFFAFVEIREIKRSFSSSNPPRTIFVFPISIVRIIIFYP